MIFSIIALTTILSFAEGSAFDARDAALSHFKKTTADQQQKMMDVLLPASMKGGKVNLASKQAVTPAPSVFESIVSLVSGEKKTKGYFSLRFFEDNECGVGANATGAPFFEFALYAGKCFDVDIDGGDYSFYVKASVKDSYKFKTQYYMGYGCEGEKIETDKDEWPSSCMGDLYGDMGGIGIYRSIQAFLVNEKKLKEENIAVKSHEAMLTTGRVKEKKSCKKKKLADYNAFPTMPCYYMSEETSYKVQCNEGNGIDLVLFTDPYCTMLNPDTPIYPIRPESGCEKVEQDDDGDDDDGDDDDDDFNVYDHLKWEYLSCMNPTPMNSTAMGNLRR